MRKFWGIEDKENTDGEVNLEFEQKLTRSEPTEQKPDDENQQNATNNTKQTNNLQNPNPNNLKNQIQNLESEISQLENNQNNNSLLNSKKEELEELQKKLNQQNNQIHPHSNSKLYLGISLGILGGGIIGLVLWLVFRKTKSDSKEIRE